MCVAGCLIALIQCGAASPVAHTRTPTSALHAHLAIPPMPPMPEVLRGLLPGSDDANLGIQALIQDGSAQLSEQQDDEVMDTTVIAAPAYPNIYQNDYLRHWGMGSANYTHKSRAEVEKMKVAAMDNAKADIKALKGYMRDVDNTIAKSNEQIVNATRKRLPASTVAALVKYVNDLHEYKEQLKGLEKEIPRGQMQYEYQLSSYTQRMEEEDAQQKKRDDMSRSLHDRLHRNDAWVANKTRHLTWNGYTKYDIDKAKQKPEDMDLVRHRSVGQTDRLGLNEMIAIPPQQEVAKEAPKEDRQMQDHLTALVSQLKADADTPVSSFDAETPVMHPRPAAPQSTLFRPPAQLPATEPVRAEDESTD